CARWDYYGSSSFDYW
nr:immunoglobulin heavy chain junction region [Mus musculus]MBK4185139.1 immunoglobulin heavy chain junction region [Mus musculus]